MFFERPKSGELAVLVHMNLAAEADQESPKELEELAISAGADPVEFLTGSLAHPNPKFFIGQGKLEELRELVQMHDAQLVIFNHALSPAQERNIEREIKCRVLDRTGLILDIFAQRARTHEGKLQVELAQLRHISTRLIRGWTHLERQKCGIGLRGPGETQLETDRRLLRGRVQHLQQQLGKVKQQRVQSRRARKRAEIPNISLVGYTNAGKSSLFNWLTDAGVYAADQLFATLDPTLRRVKLPHFGEAVLADTVGFIRYLPHDLVAAFRSTLEETREADLLVHVVDAHHAEKALQIEQVNEVLTQLEANEVPQLLVMNKIDLLEDRVPRIDYDAEGRAIRVWMSVREQQGLSLLQEAIVNRLTSGVVEQEVTLPPRAGRLRARLYQQGVVTGEHCLEDGRLRLSLCLSSQHWQQLQAQIQQFES